MPTISGQIANVPGLKSNVYSSKVYIFSGKVQPFTQLNPNHQQLVYTIIDGTNRFTTLNFAPGIYTIVMEINGRMYIRNKVPDLSSPKGRIWDYIRLENNDVIVDDLLKIDTDAFTI